MELCTMRDRNRQNAYENTLLATSRKVAGRGRLDILSVESRRNNQAIGWHLRFNGSLSERTFTN